MKKLTKKSIKEFVSTANNLYYKFYFGDKTQRGEMSDALSMLFDIDTLWHNLASDLNCWYDGDRIICEAIGETILYWDTDVVDQLSFIDDLEKLALDFYEKNKCTKAK